MLAEVPASVAGNNDRRKRSPTEDYTFEFGLNDLIKVTVKQGKGVVAAPRAGELGAAVSQGLDNLILLFLGQIFHMVLS